MEQMGRAFPFPSQTIRVLAQPKIDPLALSSFPLAYHAGYNHKGTAAEPRWLGWGIKPSPHFLLPTSSHLSVGSPPSPTSKFRLPCSDYTETTQTSISIRWFLFIKVSHSATLLATCPHQGYFFFRDGVCFDRIPPALPQWIPFALRDNFRDIKNGDEVADRLMESPKFLHITVNPKVTTFIIME